jgi:hypothetical protein
MPLFDFQCTRPECQHTEEDYIFPSSEEADTHAPTCSVCKAQTRRAISPPNFSDFIWSKTEGLAKVIGKRGNATMKDVAAFERRHGVQLGHATDARYRESVERNNYIAGEIQALKQQGADSETLAKAHATEAGESPECSPAEYDLMQAERKQATQFVKLKQEGHDGHDERIPEPEWARDPAFLDDVLRDAGVPGGVSGEAP